MISQISKLLKAYVAGEIGYAIIFVTAKCNSKCKTCFYWKNSESGSPQELTTQEYEKLTKKWKSLFHVSFTGGEPLLRNDLPEIAHMFYKNCRTRSLGLTTNGLLPEKCVQTVKAIISENPELKLKLSVSIDELGEKHDEIRGVKGNYEKLTSTIALIKEIAKINKNLELRINLTYCSYNKDNIKTIIDRISADFGLPVNIGIIRGDPRNNNSKNIKPQEYLDAVTHIKTRYKQRNETNGYFRILDNVIFRVYDITYKILEENKKVLNCVAGKNMIVISETGNVLPCEMLTQTFPDKAFVFPNLREYDFDIHALRKSNVFASLLGFIKKTGCFCTFECATMNSIAYNPLQILKLISRFK
ncbi:MAG: hypothetical protein A2252_03090 [Elusimicrobia bacterium RIFOXYA2_FULL_39_19]|nr:MAG: hypothetical protein A2252_03090 [Elusimicrobia bacterium RIFOXYA2_FULL_39_19]